MHSFLFFEGMEMIFRKIVPCSYPNDEVRRPQNVTKERMRC